MLLSGRPLALRSLRPAGLAFAIALSLSAPFDSVAKAPPPLAPVPALTVNAGDGATIARADLPREALAVDRLIRAGGPFAHPKDGIVFGNRERLLPRRPRGEWREYTVATPGARDRGARRIVCGGVPPTAPDVCYYTDDHYASFRRIAQ